VLQDDSDTEESEPTTHQPKMEKVLYVPRPNESEGRFREFADAPSGTCTQLARRWDDRIRLEGLSEAWGDIAKDPERMYPRDTCVMQHLLHQGPAYAEVAGPRDAENCHGLRACTGCIQTGSPCAYVVRHDETVKLALFPLPMEVRNADVSWKRVKFYIR
jgi:hypothetical protein